MEEEMARTQIDPVWLASRPNLETNKHEAALRQFSHRDAVTCWFLQPLSFFLLDSFLGYFSLLNGCKRAIRGSQLTK
jgi:hypothetical protein